MPQRLGLRAWLEKQIESGKFKGVEWIDDSKSKFRVPWKHASRHGWLESEDAALFKAWAVYTKRYVEDRGDDPTPKTWKANFRCAVNALPDIQPVTGPSNKKGKNACRVFEFSKKRKSREKVCQRQVPVKLNDIKSYKKKDSTGRWYERRKAKLENDIKIEPGEEYPPSCMQSQQLPSMQNQFKHMQIKQENMLKNAKLADKSDHCYQRMDSTNLKPCFKDYITSIPLLPQARDLNPTPYYNYNNYMEANYANNYTNNLTRPHISSYPVGFNSGVPMSNEYHQSHQYEGYTDLKTVLEVAQSLLGDGLTTNNNQYEMCDEFQVSDGESFMGSCRPSSVGSAASSDAELENKLMPKEEIIETECEPPFADGVPYEYISSNDPFLSEEESKNDMLEIKAITEALMNYTEFH